MIYGRNKVTTWLSFEFPFQFINAASGSEFDVGHGLKSCTSKFVRTDVFSLAGRKIILIDTPGFDDTNISDIDILKSMGGFLSAT